MSARVRKRSKAPTPSKAQVSVDLSRTLARLARQVGRGAGWAARRLASSQDAQRLTAVGLLALCMGLVSQEVRRDVAQRPEFAVDRQVTVAQPPPGLSAEVQRDLAHMSMPDHPHGFDDELVPHVAANLEAMPWVERVERVRLLPPNRLTFSVRPRQPIARLEDGALVTRDGAVIPRRYGRSPEELPLLAHVPQDAAGRVRAIEAAAQVLCDLDALAARVEAVDLDNLAGKTSALDSEVVLLLDNGLKVDWGRPGTQGLPHRPGLAKRRDLRRFLDAYPDPGKVAWVSVRWDRTTYALRPSTVASRD